MEKQETAQQETIIQSYKSLIAKQDQEIAQLRSQLQSQLTIGGDNPSAVAYPIQTTDQHTLTDSAKEAESVTQSTAADEKYNLLLREKEETERKAADQQLTITSLQQTIADLHEQLREKEEAERKAADQQLTIGSLQKTIADLHEQLAELNKDFQTSQQEMEDLLVCLAEQDSEAKRMRSRLRELGDPVDGGDTDEEE
jgi:chromosome segregation ATPase